MARSTTSGDQPIRVLSYVGKGGAGKTTVAAATAVRAAELGHRTLVVSTDTAHSLGDVLGERLGYEPREVVPRLFAEEINVLDEVRHTWGRFQSQLVEVLRREGTSAIQADELAILPGMEELAALVQIGRRIRSGQFDCIVVDAAPTGETIRLLSLPETYQWYATQVQEWRKRLPRLAGPLLRGALPDLSFLDVLTTVADRVRNGRAVLTDPQRSSHRLVVTPERVVLKEALRAETYLNVFDYPIDAVILNRLLPSEAASPFMASLLARQDEVVRDLRRAFAALPILEAAWTPEEPVGAEALSRFARGLFGEGDPTNVLHVGPTQRLEPIEGGYLLKLPMPHVETGKLSLRKVGESLFVDVGNFRREVSLPHALAPLEAGSARVNEGMLEIPFVLPKRS